MMLCNNKETKKEKWGWTGGGLGEEEEGEAGVVISYLVWLVKMKQSVVTFDTRVSSQVNIREYKINKLSILLITYMRHTEGTRLEKITDLEVRT